jgi:hypothetical protein
MRGRVYHLQLLLALASADILRSESCGTHNHILLSQIRNSPNLEGQVPVCISTRNRVARLYPQSKSKLLYDWRFTANQFVLASSPLRPRTRDFFSFQLNSCCNSPYVTSSLTRRWGCLLRICLAFRQCTFRTYSLGADPQKTPLPLLLPVGSLLHRRVYHTVA